MILFCYFESFMQIHRMSKMFRDFHNFIIIISYYRYSDYREFTCPLCRKRTQLPIGGVKKLPDNFLVSSLSEVTHNTWFNPQTENSLIFQSFFSLTGEKVLNQLISSFLNENQWQEVHFVSWYVIYLRRICSSNFYIQELV